MPVSIHIITNEDSVPYVTTVIQKLNETAECDFSSHILTLSDIIVRSNDVICPKLGLRSEFCEIVMGNMTPLLFPWLFPDLDHVIYIDRKMVFQVGTFLRHITWITNYLLAIKMLCSYFLALILIF